MAAFAIQEVSAGQGSSARLGDLTPDGRYVSYVTYQDGADFLRLRDLATGSVRDLAFAPAYTGTVKFGGVLVPSAVGLYGGQLSADGTRVLYASAPANGAAGPPEAELTLLDLRPGAGPRNLTPPYDRQATPPDQSYQGLRAAGVSDDGTTVLYGQHQAHLFANAPETEGVVVLNVSTGRTTVVTTGVGPFDSFAPLDLSGDGRFALLQTVRGGGSPVLSLLDTQSGQQTTVTTAFLGPGRYIDEDPAGAAVSADGRYVAYGTYYGDRTEVVRLDRQTDQRAVLVTGNPRTSPGAVALLAMSADGRYVAYARSAGGGVTDDLFLQDVATGAVAALGNAGTVHGAVLSADGARLAFASDGIDGDGAADVFVAEAGAPALAVGTVAGDDVVNAAEKAGAVVVRGTADVPGATVTIGAPGLPALASAKVGADGTWVAVLALGGLGDGTLALTATVTEFGKTTSVAHPVLIDTTAYVGLYTVAGDDRVNATEDRAPVTLSGYSDAVSQVVHVLLDGAEVGAPTVHGDGTWSLEVSTAGLPEGPHVVHLDATDAAGNQASGDRAFTVDRTPPAIVITDVSGDWVIGAEDGGRGVPLSGTSDAFGRTVTVAIGGVGAGTAVVGADGAWSLLADAGVAAGDVVVTASVADAAGNVATGTEHAFADARYQRLSVGPNGEQGGATGREFQFGDGYATGPSLSGDAGKVAFTGVNDFFHTGATEEYGQQGFVKDVRTGALTNVNPGGSAVGTSLSHDGRFAVFVTADALLPGDTNGMHDVYVRDLSDGSLRLASAGADGSTRAGESGVQGAAVSDDGRYVAFATDAAGLGDGSFADPSDHELNFVVVKDFATGTLTQVRPSGAAAGMANLGEVVTKKVSLSADGSVVMLDTDINKQDRYAGYYESTATFAGRWADGPIPAASTFPDGTLFGRDDGFTPHFRGSAFDPTLSADGRVVAFSNGGTVLVKDLATGSLTDATTDPDGNPVSDNYFDGYGDGPLNFSLSADGRYVAFYSQSQYLQAKTDASYEGIFVRDLATGTLTRAVAGPPSSFYRTQLGLSADGRYLAFTTNLPLVADDTNAVSEFYGTTDVYGTAVRPAAITLLPVTGDDALAGAEIGPAVPVGGTSDAAGGTVALFIDGAAAGSAPVRADGTWSTSFDARGLGPGGHRVRATVTGLFGLTASDGTVLAVGPGGGGGGDNHAPVAVADAPSLGAHTAATGDVLANDGDPDPGDALRVAAVRFGQGLAYAVPEGGTATVAGNHGTLTIGSDGRYRYAASSPADAEPFTYTVVDRQGAAADAALRFTVTPRAPAASEAFGFAFLDSTVAFVGGEALLTAPDGTAHDVTGAGRLLFTDGSIERDDGSPLVDDLFYDAANRDVYAAGGDPDLHYAQFGWREGRDPNLIFSTGGYLAANPDVRAAGIDPLRHYDQAGWTEGRSPGPGFSAEAYLAMNPDVAAARIDPLAHYLERGQAEGRTAVPGEVTGLEGHRYYGAFDATWYLATYGDVAAAVPAGYDANSFAYAHYLAFGAREGRDPDPSFSTNGYLAANPDVAQAGTNPLLHYALNGWHEGRDPAPAFGTNAYLAANPDVAAARVDPFAHYLQYGMAEGRHT